MSDYPDLSADEWDRLQPASTAAKASQWDSLLDEIQGGKIKRIDFADDKDRKGKRIAIGRLASRRGIKIDARVDEGQKYMALKLKEEAVEAPPSSTRKGGRPRKSMAQSTEESTA